MVPRRKIPRFVYNFVFRAPRLLELQIFASGCKNKPATRDVKCCYKVSACVDSSAVLGCRLSQRHRAKALEESFCIASQSNCVPRRMTSEASRPNCCLSTRSCVLRFPHDANELRFVDKREGVSNLPAQMYAACTISPEEVLIHNFFLISAFQSI